VEIDMANYTFTPSTVTAKAGDIVFYMVNNDPPPVDIPVNRHDIILTPIVARVPSLNTIATSDDFDAGQRGTFTVKGLSAGTYQYFCRYHRAGDDMVGILTVTG
jgi:plastocyanin